jgi:phosphonate degradation associated HDIG domain protein
VLRSLFEKRGDADYLGEAVSQREHALQCALLARRAAASPALVTACLLHDVGHMLDVSEGDPTRGGATDHFHEEQGERWLARHFGPDVCRPVALHVAAKRYLCATDAAYAGWLSAASQASLRLQGGPMIEAEVAAFRADAYHEAAVLLRRWDDEAKVPGLATPTLEDFLSDVRACARM